MVTFLRPAWSLLTGLILSGLGFVLALYRYPGQGAFQAVWQVGMDMLNVSIFTISLICGLAGLVMLALASRGLKRRYHEIDHVYSDHRHQSAFMD